VLAIDEAAVAGRQLTIAGSPVALNASFQATYTATALGPVPIVATAVDPSGNLGMATSALAVRDAADATPPVVAIDTPVEDAEVTFLTDVTGSATDTNLYKWTLAYQFAGETTWTEFAAGYQNVSAGTLGTLDPTLLRNGIYLVRLRAEDVNGASSETIRGIRIDGQAKIGIFRISFVDLTIPLGGIPISVVRTYDSRIKTKQDFGIGWQLDVSAGSVQHKNDLKVGWVLGTDDDPFSLPCQIVRDQREHLTEVRLSERERYVFRPTLLHALPLSGGCRADVGFELVDGTTPNAELSILGNTGVRAPGTILHNPDDPIPFTGTLTDELTGLPYEATFFQLRTEDGRVFDLTPQRGIIRIQDRNENEIFVNHNGLVSSSGKQVSFTRDAQDRITRVTDPMSRYLDYAYDAAGDLVSYTNATSDRLAERVRTEYARGIEEHCRDAAPVSRDSLPPGWCGWTTGSGAAGRSYVILAISPRADRFTIELAWSIDPHLPEFPRGTVGVAGRGRIPAG
jgi:YD repeat-containing protein